ncbi:MAG: hypothetical protein SangKO_049300 [Sandaracinaceae bacterium]
MGRRFHTLLALVAGAAAALSGCTGTLSSDGAPLPPSMDGGADAGLGPDSGPRVGVDGGAGVDGGSDADGGPGLDGGPGCTPSCAGRSCGSDGCGGSCGTCEAGNTCSGGACVATEPMCGNGVREGDERCDGDCPTSCPDTACTSGRLVGSASSCDARCESSPVTACTSGDGCCPSGCTLPADSDCSYDCTDLGSWPADWAAEEELALDEMNRHRSTGYMCASGPKMSVPPLTMDPAARVAARCHSQDMAENDFFSHTGSDGSSFSTRMRRAGYSGSPRNENIAAGNAGGVASTGQWMGSSTGHCDAVMASGNSDVGIGYFRLSGTRWTHYWTAVFGR